MRKWHFGDAKVPLLVYESAALGCYMALADDVFCISARHALPAEEGKRAKKDGQRILGMVFRGRKGLLEFSVLSI